ncbi:MAG TPA: type II secretion system F family protein, partial [Acidimicrobiales bacterium]|nr:type II secretion system F family protein [Acidimicrobiales bacterium]
MTVLIALLVLPAAALVTWGVLTVVARERPKHLERALAPYTVGGVEMTQAPVGATGTPELVESPVLQRLVSALAQVATEQGLLQVVKAKLDQADLPVRPAEALFVNVVGAVVGGALGLLLGSPVWGLVCLLAVGALPWMALLGAAKRRSSAFTGQLPDMLQLLGTTLRSGFSILQGLDTVAQQVSDPIGKEMRHVVAEARLGRPLVDAMREVAQRGRSDDFEWVVTAIGIQREVG